MNKTIKSIICVGLAAICTASLCACSTTPAETLFDNPLPWRDPLELAPRGSYEKLDYDVAIYDTTKGSEEDKRVQIADGKVTYVLRERANGYVTLSLDFSVTYSDAASEKDRGLTDTIKSEVEFESNSLAARRSTKTVSLAPRADTPNLSYTVAADYFDDHTATVTYAAGEQKTMKLPTGICRDNEMMFLLARSQSLASGASNIFRMVNLYDSFNTGKLTQYTMSVRCDETVHTINVGDWVKDFGVESVTDEESGNVSYPVSCHYATISINAEHYGPPYAVMYSEKPFVDGDGRSHAKIPVNIQYSEYASASPSRTTEYSLTSCSFTETVEA